MLKFIGQHLAGSYQKPEEETVLPTNQPNADGGGTDLENEENNEDLSEWESNTDDSHNNKQVNTSWGTTTQDGGNPNEGQLRNEQV